MNTDKLFAIFLVVGIAIPIGLFVYLIANDWNPARDRCAEAAEKLGFEFWRYKSSRLGVAEECWALNTEGEPIQIW